MLIYDKTRKLCYNIQNLIMMKQSIKLDLFL